MTATQSDPASSVDQGLALEINYVLDEIFKHKLAPRGDINISADILYHAVISYMLDIRAHADIPCHRHSRQA